MRFMTSSKRGVVESSLCDTTEREGEGDDRAEEAEDCFKGVVGWRFACDGRPAVELNCDEKVLD